MATKLNGRFIDIWLAENRLSQVDLATRAGVTTQTISRMRKGAPFRSRTIDALATVMGCSFHDLIEDAADPLMDASTVEAC